MNTMNRNIIILTTAVAVALAVVVLVAYMVTYAPLVLYAQPMIIDWCKRCV